MDQRILALSFGFAVLIAATHHGFAAPAPQSGPCGLRTTIVAQLDATHGEVLRAAEPLDNDHAVELFTSPRTGSWTLALHHADGRLCLISSGFGARIEAQTSPRPNKQSVADL